jgi:hypothetical protein
MIDRGFARRLAAGARGGALQRHDRGARHRETFAGDRRILSVNGVDGTVCTAVHHRDVPCHFSLIESSLTMIVFMCCSFVVTFGKSEVRVVDVLRPTP